MNALDSIKGDGDSLLGRVRRSDFAGRDLWVELLEGKDASGAVADGVSSEVDAVMMDGVVDDGESVDFESEKIALNLELNKYFHSKLSEINVSLRYPKLELISAPEDLRVLVQFQYDCSVDDFNRFMILLRDDPVLQMVSTIQMRYLPRGCKLDDMGDLPFLSCLDVGADEDVEIVSGDFLKRLKILRLTRVKVDADFFNVVRSNELRSLSLVSVLGKSDLSKVSAMLAACGNLNEVRIELPHDFEGSTAEWGELLRANFSSDSHECRYYPLNSSLDDDGVVDEDAHGYVFHFFQR